MLFVSEATNQELETKPFAEKKKILVAEQVPMDPFLSSAKKWKFEDIALRTASLAKTAYEDIWKL